MSKEITTKEEGFKKLMEPFPDSEISWLPKPTRAQTEEVKRNVSSGIRCKICGAFHHPKVVHLSYVGHAAVTKRLLTVDPEWNWEFLQVDEQGMPIIDNNGGMWISLTILGVTRKGYGDSEGKRGPSATKELIGDAIRNAAMRFGVALELWHKGEFEKTEDTQIKEETLSKKKKQQITDERLQTAFDKIDSGEYTLERLENDFEITDAQRKKFNMVAK